ncbi:MAG: Omp28-related outer membrane protein [Chitinophagaceae bacterium]|nr:Omp28-related outer membrane protein [Chitinophagaceae bacterium]
MKKLVLLSIALCLFAGAKSQVSFNDNFDSYTVGSALGPQSPTWTTWSGAQGGADDINVTNTDAHSGSNSLYFTSTATTGGPADIILPLGGLHKTGGYVYTHWMKIVSGKKAYFNYQGTGTVSQIYTMNYTFSNGTLTIDDATKLTLTTTYPQGVWFEFKLQANLNTNDWEVFINGVSKGKFQNSTFQIASIDYFASDNNNAFWIDDVSFDYTPYTLPATNGAMAIVGIDNGIVTQTRATSVTVRNLGTNAISSFDISLNANGTMTNQSVSSVNIASGASYALNLTAPVTLISGLNTFIATIKNVNGSMTDGDGTDDSKTITFTPITAGSDKLVIGEEATGTWCQWCPRGAVALRNMDAKYNGFFQGIAVHNGDPMTVPAYDSGIGTKISGYPSGLTDRLPKIDPSNFEADFLTRVILTPVAKILNGANYNASNGQLDVSLTTTFKANASGNYSVLCVLIEDSVKGTTSGYNQANAYAGGANGVMGGFELLPSSVPAAQMTYDHVARAIAPNFFGIPNAYPSSVVAGSSYIHNFSFNISTWNKNKMHIIGMIIAPDGKIENASSSTIDKAVQNGFVVGTNQVASTPNVISLYPNPSNDMTTLLINLNEQADALINICDMNGKTIMQQHASLVSGSNSIPVSLKGMASGNYIVTAIIGNKTYALQLTKN